MDQQILSSTTTTSGTPLEIYHSPTLTMSPVYPLFLRGISALISSGNRESYKSWDDDLCGSVYAMHGKDIIGQLVYSKEDKKILFVVEAFVEPDFRGQGIYTILHQQLEVLAKDMGYWAVSINVPVDNLDGLKLANKLGMSSVFYRMLKKI